jgi:hypothetical protein
MVGCEMGHSASPSFCAEARACCRCSTQVSKFSSPLIPSVGCNADFVNRTDSGVLCLGSFYHPPSCLETDFLLDGPGFFSTLTDVGRKATFLPELEKDFCPHCKLQNFMSSFLRHSMTEWNPAAASAGHVLPDELLRCRIAQKIGPQIIT